MEISPKNRLISTIRRERTDRLPVAPPHYDPAFLIQSMELPGDLEYYMLNSARPELFRVGLPTHRVSVEANLNLAEKLGFDPVFFKGIRLGLPPGVSVEHSRENRGDLTLITSVYDTPASQLRKTERQYREERLRRDASHGASSDRSQEHLIKEPADLERLAFLTDHTEPRDLIAADFEETANLVGDRGLIFAEVPHPMMLAVEFYGFENFLISMVTTPEFARDLLDICNRETVGHIRTVLDMGAEAIYLDGVFSTPSLIAPTHFDQFLSPLIDQYVSLLHSQQALLHLFVDGKCLDVLGILRDLQADMVSPMDPPPWGDADIGHVKKVVGEQLCYMGGINAPVDLVQQSRDDIVRMVQDLIEKAPERGFILSTADSVQTDTPVENYLAMIETAFACGDCD